MRGVGDQLPAGPLQGRQQSAPRLWLVLVVGGACAIGLLWVGLPEAFSPVGQWDFEAFYYAVKVHDAGGNAWDHEQVVKVAGGAVNHLMYPPHTLVFFRLFALDDVRAAKDVYLATKLACLAALIALWLGCFVRAGARGWFLAFAALGYNATICRDLVVGNTSLLEQVPIWFGLWALLRGRLWLFCVLIVLAGQLKFLPLVLLTLVLLTDSRYKWHYLLGSVAVCALVAGAVYWWDPQAVRTYVSLLGDVGFMEPGGAIHPCSRTLIRDLVTKVLEMCSISAPLLSRKIAYPMYAAWAAGVVLTYVLVVRRGRNLRSAVYLGLLTYALAAPRMKDYSYILVLVPTFELLRNRLAKPGSGKWLIIGVAALLTLPGLDVLWQYRAILLVGWVWVASLRDEFGLAAGGVPASGTGPSSGELRM